MEEKKIPLKKFFPGIAWFFIVAILTLMPGRDLPKIGWLDRIPNFDKLVHAGLFGGLTLLFCLPYFKTRLSFQKKINNFIRIALAVSIWGITVEFLQKYFIPGRDFELLDWAADSAGALIAFFLCRKIISTKFLKYNIQVFSNGNKYQSYKSQKVEIPDS
ncbi:MAG: VanZ family protein [Bacteroidota bacterium]|nr:VanZ family protein [Bacteroidota bacterium]